MKLIKEAKRMQQIAGLVKENTEITVDPHLYKQCEEDRQWYLDNTVTNQLDGPMNKAEALAKYEELAQDQQEVTTLVYKGAINPFLN
jgi:hypothetical protein